MSESDPVFTVLEYETCFLCGHTRLRVSTTRGLTKTAAHVCGVESRSDGNSSRGAR